MANNILDLLNKIKAVSNKFEKYNEDQFRRGFFSDENSAKKLYNTLNTNKKNDSKWNIIPTITSLDLFLKTYVCNDDQITWKSNCSSCIQLNPPNTTVKLEDYTGLFKSNVAKDGLFLISIDNDGTTESLVIKSYQLPIEFGEATLVSTNQKNLFILGSPKITEYVNKLPLLTDAAKNSILTKLTVKFADDLNSFDYDVYITKGTATRSGEKIKNVEKKKNDNTDDQKKPEKKFEPDYKKSVLKFDNNKNYTINQAINNLKYYLDNDLNPNEIFIFGGSDTYLLGIFINKENYEIIELLLKKGADPNILDYKAGLGRLLMVLTYNKPILELLLNYNADINKLKDISNNTILHMACNLNSPEVVYLIIKNKNFNEVFKNLVNDENKTALDIAIEKNFNDIVTLLT
jgi:hypothetical protein